MSDKIQEIIDHIRFNISPKTLLKSGISHENFLPEGFQDVLDWAEENDWVFHAALKASVKMREGILLSELIGNDSNHIFFIGAIEILDKLGDAIISEAHHEAKLRNKNKQKNYSGKKPVNAQLNKWDAIKSF